MRTAFVRRRHRAALFLLCIAACAGAGAPVLAQTCERNVVVGYSQDDLGPQDFQAELDKKLLAISSVQPVLHWRILVMVDGSDWKTHAKNFRKRITLITRLAAGVPEDNEVAYGLFSQKGAEYSSFTSERAKARRDLEDLVARLKSPPPATEDCAPPGPCLADSPQSPTPRRSKPKKLPSLRVRPKNQPLEETRPGDVVVMVTDSGSYAPRNEAQYLQDGVRFFMLVPPDEIHPDAYSGDLNALAAATGGYSVPLQSSAFYWSNAFGRASILKIQIPADANGTNWSIKLSPSASKRYAVPKNAVLYYPDLLLCGTGPGGEALIAGRLDVPTANPFAAPDPTTPLPKNPSSDSKVP